MHPTRCLHLLACLLLTSLAAKGHSSDDFIHPVPLHDVKLKYNSQYDKAVSLNREYLLGLGFDRMLHTFRLTANLPAPGEPFSGSWEDPGCEVRGQFMGHWLSGTAMLGKNTGDKELIKRAEDMISELKKVQDAEGGGYFSAFPTEHFDRLRRLESVWAPFYVIHKLMAGLLDHYLFLGNKVALQMVIDEAEFFLNYIEDILAKEGYRHWVQMLETEYGGMEETLYNLYDVTQNDTWIKMAKYFTKPNFFEPLKANTDTLPGRHANTHLAQVNGFAAGYEKTGCEERHNATRNFFDIIINAHTYATGGNNDGELWQAPHELAPSLAGEGAGRNTEETCTTYNMMKLARYLFRWTGNASYVDYYERAILNGMLGVQRMPANYTSKNGHPLNQSPQNGRKLLSEEPHRLPEERAVPANATLAAGTAATNEIHPHSTHNWRQAAYERFDAGRNLADDANAPGPGVILYLLPLGAGNVKGDNFHGWSTPLGSFWCCSGSNAESFGKLMDSIFFHRKPVKPSNAAPELYINQLTPSTLTWTDGGLSVDLEASLYSADNVARATITLGLLDKNADSVAADLKLRIPKWTVIEAGPSVKLNGKALAKDDDLTPGTYYTLSEDFKSGDVVDLELPMAITTETINDYRPWFQNLKAVLVGPLLMAGLTDHDRDIQADPEKVSDMVHEVSREGLVSLTTASGELALHNSHGQASLVLTTACQPAMDCSFRLVQPISRDASTGEVLERQLVVNRTQGQMVSLESMASPGHFLIHDAQGAVAMEHMTASAFKEGAIWKLRPGADQRFDSYSLEAAEAPGSFLAPAGLFAGRQTLRACPSNASTISFRIIEALGEYPPGAKVLKGDNKEYIVAPQGNIVEERYTTYFDFQKPQSAVDAGEVVVV